VRAIARGYGKSKKKKKGKCLHRAGKKEKEHRHLLRVFDKRGGEKAPMGTRGNSPKRTSEKKREEGPDLYHQLLVTVAPKERGSRLYGHL